MRTSNRLRATPGFGSEADAANPESPRELFTARSLAAPQATKIDRGMLAESLWKTLPISTRTGNSPRDNKAISDSYHESRTRITRAASEIDQLFSAVARANLEMRGDLSGDEKKRRAEYREKLGEMRRTLSFEHQLSVPLSGDGAASEVQELTELRIEIWLRAEIDSLLDAFLERLDQLVAVNVIGELIWDGDAKCRFHFCGETLVRNLPVVSTRDETSTVREGFREITTRDKLTVATHSTTHRKVRHEHRLEGAMQVGLANCSTAVPKEIAQVINAIPSWLGSVAGIVVGECVHERIIEQDVAETIGEEVIGRESVRTERYIDPALVIGNYVLAGWSDRGINAAEKHDVRTARLLQIAASQKERGQIAAVHRSIGFAAIVLGLIFFAITVSRSVLLPAAAVGLTIGGILLLLYSAYLRTSWRSTHEIGRDIAVFGAQLGFAIGAVFSGMAAFALESLLPAVFIVLFATAFFLTRRVARE